MYVPANTAVKLIAIILAVPLTAVEIAHDGFEDGSLTGPLWVGATSVSVSTDRAHAGTHAAKFRFAGDASLDADAFSELRFDLGAVYPEVWLRYRLFIPSNYVHRDATGSDNNKMIRLWGRTYDDLEKIGASTWLDSPADGFSSLMLDWNWHGDGIGPKGVDHQGFIAAGDLGTWMDVIFHAKAATSGNLGTMQIWKNGVLACDGTGTMDNFTTGEAHGYRYGYLLGWSNSGFTATTDFYIDDVVFGTTKADVVPVAVNHAPVAVPMDMRTTVDVPCMVTLVATDADGDVLSYRVLAGPAHGLLTGSGASLIYTPTGGFVGSDSFVFNASDGLSDSNDATWTVEVTASGGGLVDAADGATSRVGTGDGGACGSGSLLGLFISSLLLPLRRRPSA
jgi:hypothetical protein